MLRQEGARVAGKMVRLIDHFLPLMSSDETDSGRQRLALSQLPFHLTNVSILRVLSISG
jgi:hypothetical protein